MTGTHRDTIGRLLVEVGDWAPEPLLPHALNASTASTATMPQPAIDLVRTTERY